MPATPHTAQYEIRGFECDPLGRIHPRRLCLLLQESATLHAAELGVGVDTLIDGGIAWVMSQLKLEIDRWPTAGETLTVETWPEAASGTRTDRRFRMLDRKGQELGRAITLWLVMDLERRRPTRLPEFITSGLEGVIRSTRPTRLDPIPSLEEAQREQRIQVGFSDIDMVHHANNAAFVQWAVECVPESLWSTHDPAEVEVHYLSECRLGDIVVSQVAPVEDSVKSAAHHRLIRSSDGVEVARARSLWRRR